MLVALSREAAVVRRAARAAGVADRVRIACGGIGPARAADAAGELLAHGVTRVLITGYAGALDPRLAAGDLLLADDARDGGDATRHACDADLLSRAGRALAGEPALHRGSLASVERILDGAADRAALARRSGALAVDMESAAAAAVAARHGVPWVALRAISDVASQRVPRVLERMLDPWGRPTPVGVLRALCGDPLGLRHLPALARGARSADRGLRRALSALLPALATDGG